MEPCATKGWDETQFVRMHEYTIKHLFKLLQKGSVMETQSNRSLNSGRHIGVFTYEAYLADEIGGECLDPDKDGDIVYRDDLDNTVLSTVQVVVPRDYPKENAIRHIRKIADWIERDGIPAELPPGEENRYRPA
jgi:hypothetical protein